MLGFLVVAIVKVPNGSGASQVALVVKNPPANAGDIGDPGSTPGWGRFPGGGHGNLLQYSCLTNPTDRTWGLKESHTIEMTEHKHAATIPYSLFL